MLKLYARIDDKQNNTHEWIELVQFNSEKDETEKVFVELVEHHEMECFKVVVDEGYVTTEYYYPTYRYLITHLEVLK